MKMVETPGITQPSRTAQEELIRETYRKAKTLIGAYQIFLKLMARGTAIGDPREAQAIGFCFSEKHRSTTDPVYVYVSNKRLSFRA